jgi:branched-chain amino acid transport system ATP-binding protein
MAVASVDADHPPILSVANLEVVYSDVIRVLRGVSLDVPTGSIVALLGANGAGKTTLLRAITGLLPVHHGKITKGEIDLDGSRITEVDSSTIIHMGLAQVMEGRRVFAELTVAENLRIGGLARRNKRGLGETYEEVLELFPVLRDRERRPAGLLSGGEQQMLAIGQALMADPRMLLLDEPSLGLSTKNARQIRDLIVEINRRGTGILLVEQNAKMALAVADHAYVLENGKVVQDGTSAELLADRDIREFYLGVGESGRLSFRDVKSYRRKKRWSA